MYVKDEPLVGMKLRDDGKQQQQQQAVIQETANIKSLNDGLNSLVQAAGIANIIEEAPIIRPSQAAVQYNRAVAEATDVRVQVKDNNQEQQTMAVSFLIFIVLSTNFFKQKSFFSCEKLRGMKRYSRYTKEVFTSFHKNNVNFVWLATPQFFYAILFRAVRGAILVILNKINRAVYF